MDLSGNISERRSTDHLRSDGNAAAERDLFRFAIGKETFQRAVITGYLMHILVAEGDRSIGEATTQALREAMYAVDWVTDGQTAIEAAREKAYDLALLDLSLSAPDGIEVLRQLRTMNNQLPVIVVATHDAVDDRIHALDLGAADCLVKPFEVRELIARMRAILRRQDSGSSTILTNGVISLNSSTHEVVHTGGRAYLTAREFTLLQALMLRPGAILSRTDLERHIYGWNEEIESNAVEFLIHAIRKKLGASSIRNVRGMGWMVDQS